MPNADHFQIKGNAAEFYDKLPARYLLGPWSKGLVDAAQLQPNDRVIDLACGTGVVTREAAERLGEDGHITGLDLNEGMLAVAREYPKTSACEIRWIKASALDTGLTEATYDVALCQQGLQFFPYPLQALAETHRILKESGRLCFSIWAQSGPYNDAVADAVRIHIDNETAQRFLQSRDVPSASELRQLFIAAGFREVNVACVERRNRLPSIAEFVAEHLLGVPIADRVRQLSEAQRLALGADAANRMSQFADGEDAVVPDFINLVSAKR